MRELLDVAYAVWFDSFDGWVDRQKLSDDLDQAMRNAWPDRETWAVDSASVESTPAMMEAQAQRLTPEEQEKRRRERDERRAAAGAAT